MKNLDTGMLGEEVFFLADYMGDSTCDSSTKYQVQTDRVHKHTTTAAEDLRVETGRPAGYGASETLMRLHPQSSLTSSSSEAVWITHRADHQSGEEGMLSV